MAVQVIDTEFKLVPYSGDDEHWPQWVLKFEAWSELVGWGRQLDAIFVVKLEGKALGIVQLVGKGEGLEAWCQLK